MATLLEQALALPCRRRKRSADTERDEVLLAYLDGKIGGAAAAKVLGIARNNCDNLARSFLAREYRAGRLVWKEEQK